MILNGRQIREGRALAGLSQVDLATAAGVAFALIARIESVDGMVMARKVDRESIQCILGAASIVLLLRSSELSLPNDLRCRGKLHGQPGVSPRLSRPYRLLHYAA